MIREAGTIILVLLSITALWVMHEEDQKKTCLEAQEKLAECQKRYSDEACKEIYLPDVCPDSP